MRLKGPTWVSGRENDNVCAKIRIVTSFRGTNAGIG